MKRRFRLAGRARSTVLFKEGETLEINYHIDGKLILLTFRTRYLDRGHRVKVPGDLWLDAVGEADDLNRAASLFTNAGRDMASFLALSANASIAVLEPELILEVTPGLGKREYFQRFLPEDGFTYTSRFFDRDAALKLIQAVAKSSERDRLIRATSFYCEALRNWVNGSELMALSYLFMGVEAITAAALRHHLLKSGLSQESLAAEWGYAPSPRCSGCKQPTSPSGRLSIGTFLNQEARVRLVFQGDRRCHKVAKETSDRFEHGLANAGALYKSAEESLQPTAEFLRKAILTVADLSNETVVALGKNSARPRGPAEVDTYLRAFVVGDGPELAAPGDEYPFFRWKPVIKNVDFDETTNRYKFEPADELTAHLADGITFQTLSIEIWDRSVFAGAVTPASARE